jgi:hypothetical protein
VRTLPAEIDLSAGRAETRSTSRKDL